MVLPFSLANINAAWKTATEAMYAQGEQGQAQDAQPQGDATGDQTQDVEFEEVKDEVTYHFTKK